MFLFVSFTSADPSDTLHLQLLPTQRPHALQYAYTRCKHDSRHSPIFCAIQRCNMDQHTRSVVQVHFSPFALNATTQISSKVFSTIENMDSIESLRAILAKSPQKASETTKATPNQQKRDESHYVRTTTAFSVSVPVHVPVLRYPAINVPGNGHFVSRSVPHMTEVHISSSANMNRARRLQYRKIGWVDQTTNRHHRPAPSNPTPEQAAHRFFYDGGISRESTGSTLSLTSTFDDTPTVASTLPLTPPKENVTDPKGNSELKTNQRMSSTLAAAHDVNRNNGSIWDPDDDEWLDAGQVLDTFKASYKIPTPQYPPKSSAFMTIGATIKTVLLSPTKKTNSRTEHDEGVKEKIEELGNTFCYDSAGDLNDEVMRAALLPSTHYFPSRVPDSPRYMHIIDLESYFTSTDPLLQRARPRLCDAVATVLSHTSKECLEAFLDPSIREFVYRRKVDNNEGGRILIIRRDGNEVICGAYHNLAFRKLWKLYVKSAVSVTGQWHEVYATLRTGEMAVNEGVPDWSTILPELKDETLGVARTESAQRKLELSPSKKTAKIFEDVRETSPKFMLYQSRVLAERLLWDIWYRFDKKYECRATWTADGEESGVRLMRALVGSGNLDD